MKNSYWNHPNGHKIERFNSPYQILVWDSHNADDILRDFIGIICNVYMDDILIYLRNENSHLQHVEQVISVLEKSGKGISPE